MLDNPNLLLTSLMVSLVGFSLFLYGKRQARWPQMGVGLVMTVYTYFISSVPIALGIAAGLVGLLWLLVRMGW
jgi:hypothetical protein